MPVIRFLPHDREVEAPVGASLLDVASLAGVRITAPCGGEGACGQCLVRIEAGSVESVSRGCLNREDLDAGWALACSSRIIGDLTVRVDEKREAAGGQIVVDRADHPHAPKWQQRGQEGEPVVVKFRLEVMPPSLDNAFSDLERLSQALRPIAGRKRRELACGLPVLRQLADAMRADANGYVTVAVRETPVSSYPVSVPVEIVCVEPGDTTTRAYGLAIDIGTTTCAVHLVNLARNQVMATASDYNRQRERGHDVISRINYAATTERLQEMRFLVLDSLNDLIEGLCRNNGVAPQEIVNTVVAGNTTMIHLLLGLNPDSIRREPYTPTVNRPPLLRSEEVGLKINSEAVVMIAPGVGSYVGGDITAGLLMTDLTESGEDVALFVDIGTNGEIVVGNGEWMMGCAASAGPAFEGCGIGCGMRAVAGAIERVRIEPATGRAKWSVIGRGKPVGICGSGLIDLLAELWLAGLLQPSGKLNESCDLVRPSGESSRNLAYVVVPAEETLDGRDVVITEQDILNLLRAKAAVYSACAVMLRSVDLEFDAVARVYVAGGFGRYLDLEKAITVGLLPDLPLERYCYLGNSSLAGAHALLTNNSARHKIVELADRLTYLELSIDPSYMDEYTAALFLPHTDGNRFPSVMSKTERQSCL